MGLQVTTLTSNALGTLPSSDLSTVNGSDYTTESDVTFSFSRCQTRSCVTVAIVDDLVLELVEYFHIFLERTGGLDSRITLTPDEGRVNINDDDGKCIHILAW